VSDINTGSLDSSSVIYLTQSQKEYSTIYSGNTYLKVQLLRYNVRLITHKNS